MHPLGSRIALLFVLVAAHADAAQSVLLPAWVCAHPDAVQVDGFDGQMAVPHDPSNGNGGDYPGSLSRTLHIVGLGSGTQTYYLYLPSDYTPTRSWPLVLALHGVAPDDNGSYATIVRDRWSPVATAGHFIVAAPVADQVGYDSPTQMYYLTWLVPPAPSPNDYDLFAAIRADLEGAYNIERTRLYGWGFSAGGHVMHALGVNKYSSVFNASTMAAYSVSAGDLAGMACEGLADADCSQLLASLPRKIPVDLHVGTSDMNYPNVASDHNRFLAQGWVDGQSVFIAFFNGDHDYSTTDLQLAWGNLCPNAVMP